MTKELEGKTALVTGASRGLGVHMALRLARGGALVAVNYASDEAAANETVRLIEKEGGKAFAVQARLGSEVAARELADKLDVELTARTGGNRLDILVNNIGGGDYGGIRDTDEAMYDQMFDNNVKGPFFLTRALYERLNDFGRVINISSTGARLTDPSIIVYTMAKTAVEAFTRVLALELGKRGITVNSVAPGFTAGPTNDYIVNDPVSAKQVTDITALNRFGQPEEIADVVYFLASSAGRWVTAQHIEASGGFRL
ncbi:SDR family oxidoreductase [Aquamicrobium sp.]|uniref:SDR family oxidoreductase n=1 Tax=Aquamicrobium sp. TaxID=1872579 RepID=UPI002582AA68|nr:SDR family oxidoreductase [Aquamicrobium sp.]MCK9553758.1 SDR family oxidoreductase [Aquamicrobium sp.]